MPTPRVSVHMPAAVLAGVLVAAHRLGITPHAWIRRAIAEQEKRERERKEK